MPPSPEHEGRLRLFGQDCHGQLNGIVRASRKLGQPVGGGGLPSRSLAEAEVADSL